MDRHILIKNFWNVGLHGDKSVAKEDLGWSDYIKRDARLTIRRLFFVT